jgi:TPR repeat protein
LARSFGFLYENGYGTSKDMRQVVEYYKLAANLNYFDAEYKLIKLLLF